MKRKGGMVMVIVASVALLAGCVETDTPRGFNELKRPITIVANNEGGLTVTDGDGNLYSWRSSYYFTESILKAGYEPGDILVDVTEPPKKVDKAPHL